MNINSPVDLSFDKLKSAVYPLCFKLNVLQCIPSRDFFWSRSKLMLNEYLRLIRHNTEQAY